MRLIAFLLLACLAGCAGDPRSYGITGPAERMPPARPDDATVDQPGLQAQPSTYGPSMQPTTGSGRFWGYN
jgi:hypothetical protein